MQLSTDGTSRRHIPFQYLIISLMGDDMEIDPTIVLFCIFLDDESAQSTMNSIFTKVCLSFLSFKFSTIHIDVIFVIYFSQLNLLQERIKMLREVLTRYNPSF